MTRGPGVDLAQHLAEAHPDERLRHRFAEDPQSVWPLLGASIGGAGLDAGAGTRSSGGPSTCIAAASATRPGPVSVAIETSERKLRTGRRVGAELDDPCFSERVHVEIIEREAVDDQHDVGVGQPRSGCCPTRIG